MRRPSHWKNLGTIGCGLVAGVLFCSGAEPSADQLWSLQPVRRVELNGEGNPIDALVRKNLGREVAPPADRRTLIRRLSYNLTGLPADPELVEEFVGDQRSDEAALRAIVEPLLASKHYGEHWGRHWLDVVRYADTAGENSDHPVPHAWRYRNWVIDAFNDDKPYDEFVREQLAGDLVCKDLPAAQRNAGIVATGYLAISRRFGHDIDKRKYLMYEDTIDNIGKAFLGLSISCARCHDHKHDPISMQDYYALYGVLDSTTFSFPGCEPKQQPRDLISLGSQDLAERVAWEKRRDELQARSKPVNQARKAKALREMATKCSKVISNGEVPDAGSVHVTEKPLSRQVRKGEAIQLAVLPRGNHGADTTIVEFTITHGAGPAATRWSVLDILDDLLISNPHPAAQGAAWCFLDIGDSDPALLSTRNQAVDGKSELNSWQAAGEGLPSVLVNKAEVPVKVWYTLPPRTFFCHPSERGPVAIAWLSPLEGEVVIDLKVSDGHPGGDGVAWRLEHFADPAMAEAYRELGSAMVASAELAEEIAAHAALKPKAQFAYAVAEGAPKNARIHLRGDHENLGEETPRTFLSAMGGGSLGDGKASGRLELADKIARAENPLTARVMVNRIWAWHFGRGLVATPNDFGHHGSKPTDPELLDYLASYFIEHDWSVKAVHRLILGSETYRREAGEAPGYACFARRRITAEELRDTLLVASGELDRTVGEAHPFPAEAKWSFTQHAPFASEFETLKRSVYVMRKRNRSDRFFALFNGADPNASTAMRDVTTAPTQALYFMNDPFFHRSAKKFSVRILNSSSKLESRLDFACQQLFARPAREEEVEGFRELAIALDAVVDGSAELRESEIWESYARILLGCNELLHLD